LHLLQLLGRRLLIIRPVALPGEITFTLLSDGNETFSPSKSASVQKSPELADGARCSVRTCTTAVQHQALTGVNTQIDTQKLRDSSELVEIIKSWTALPEPLKAGVLAIVRSRERGGK
jgi:hypothetical protein